MSRDIYRLIRHEEEGIKIKEHELCQPLSSLRISQNGESAWETQEMRPVQVRLINKLTSLMSRYILKDARIKTVTITFTSFQPKIERRE